MLEGPSPSAKVGGKIEVARFATSGGTGGTARLGIAKGAVDLKELAAPEKRKNRNIFREIDTFIGLCSLDIYFSSNDSIHKSLFGLYFWAPDQLVHRFLTILSIKGYGAHTWNWVLV